MLTKPVAQYCCKYHQNQKIYVMHRIGKMDYRMKRRMGIISFLPLLSYMGWLIQYLIIMRSLISKGIMEDHVSMSSLLSQNYGGTLFFFSLCFAITAAVLVYFVIHIARLVSMNGAAKTTWILFMTFAAPIAFPVFWYTEIRREPEELPLYPDIA